MEIENGYLDVENGNLYYQVAGEGHPLLLIHAGIADHRMWDDQMGPFAEHFRVIRYDTRGFGKSFVAEEAPYSNRRDIRDLFAHLGIESAYVVAVSRGGQIATDLALESPKLVDALVLVGSGLGGWDMPGYEPTEVEMQIFKKYEELESTHDWEGLADNDVQMWVDGPGQPAGRAPEPVRAKVRQMCLDTYTTHEVEGQPVVLDPAASGRLSELQVPTLVIVGDLDSPAIDLQANELVFGIAGARKVVMHGTAHVPNMEKPDEFNKIVLDFLLGLEQQA